MLLTALPNPVRHSQLISCGPSAEQCCMQICVKGKFQGIIQCLSKTPQQEMRRSIHSATKQLCTLHHEQRQHHSEGHCTHKSVGFLQAIVHDEQSRLLRQIALHTKLFQVHFKTQKSPHAVFMFGCCSVNPRICSTINQANPNWQMCGATINGQIFNSRVVNGCVSQFSNQIAASLIPTVKQAKGVSGRKCWHHLGNLHTSLHNLDQLP